MHDFMCKQNQAFAWNDLEQGHFEPKFFPPIKIPVIPHVPFIKWNIPIPPGIYQEVCGIRNSQKKVQDKKKMRLSPAIVCGTQCYLEVLFGLFALCKKVCQLHL